MPEFSDIFRMAEAVLGLRPARNHKIDLASSGQASQRTTTVAASVRSVMLVATGPVNFAIGGATVTASAGTPYLPANTPLVFGVKPGVDRVAVRLASAVTSQVFHVTELKYPVSVE